MGYIDSMSNDQYLLIKQTLNVFSLIFAYFLSICKVRNILQTSKMTLPQYLKKYIFSDLQFRGIFGILKKMLPYGTDITIKQ